MQSSVDTRDAIRCQRNCHRIDVARVAEVDVLVDAGTMGQLCAACCGSEADMKVSKAWRP